jgi:nitrate/TMAO reductase-like tetraheme cytochrome c subunit
MTKNIDKREKSTKEIKKISGWAIAFFVLAIISLSIFGFLGTDNYIRNNPEFCASCHNMESHVESYLTSNHLDNLHNKANVGCKDCHADYTVIDEAQSLFKYATNNYNVRFSRIKVEDSMCLSCHIGGEILAAQTDYLVRNPHESHWPNAKCTDCHLSHEKQVNYCARCHDDGGQRMLEDPVISRAENPWAKNDEGN